MVSTRRGPRRSPAPKAVIDRLVPKCASILHICLIENAPTRKHSRERILERRSGDPPTIGTIGDGSRVGAVVYDSRLPPPHARRHVPHTGVFRSPDTCVQ